MLGLTEYYYFRQAFSQKHFFRVTYFQTPFTSKEPISSEFIINNEFNNSKAQQIDNISSVVFAKSSWYYELAVKNVTIRMRLFSPNKEHKYLVFNYHDFPFDTSIR